MRKIVSKEKKQMNILKHISIILNREIKSNLLCFVSVHDVKLNNNNSYAKIYYGVISVDDKQKTTIENELEEQKNEIRYLLSQKLKSYGCPKLEFIYDDLLEKANKIEKLIG